MRMARRLEAMGQPKYQGITRKLGGRSKWNGTVRIDEKSLTLPTKWKKGKLIFVNSMSDLFHERVLLTDIHRVFEVMRACPQHTFQILTKRAGRLEELSADIDWPENVWMGVSIENADFGYRADHLRRTGAAIKFLSLEPLLGPLDGLDLMGINWVIVGGESGPGARPMDAGWVRSIRDQCVDAGVALHFKQWGGVNKKKAGRTLDDRTWDEFPE